MARVFGRRWSRYRSAMVRLVLAGSLAAATALLWWWPFAWHPPRPGWAGTEQVGWIAGIVSAALSVVSTIAAVKALRTTTSPTGHPVMADDLVQIGRVPQRAAWFQDRLTSAELARAAKAGRTAVLTQVLSGMGGVGKTQLAAQFARQLTENGELDVLVWVTASDRDAIIATYADAARSLHLADTDTGPETAAERLAAWLEHPDQRWLIVLDNLDTPAVASGWWPPRNRNGRAIITTRRRDAVLHTDDRTMITVDLSPRPKPSTI